MDKVEEASIRLKKIAILVDALRKNVYPSIKESENGDVMRRILNAIDALTEGFA